MSLETEWEEQFAALTNDLANRAWFDQVAAQTLRPEALIQPGDRDPADVVLRRTAALLADVKRLGGSDLAEAELHLAALQKAAAAISPDHGEARYVLYADACRLRRQIAFRNPLLDFQELLFAKRHRAIYPHMCDQYYGIAAMPGGGLYVLSDPFGAHPQLRDVLADSVVRSGRLTGQKLSGGPNKPWRIAYDGMGNLSGEETVGGSFLSPDLSYDGRSIVFAYVECTGDRHHDHHTDPSSRALGRGAVLPCLSGERRRVESGPVDRRDLERLRPALAAQRADRLCLRAAGRLPALWPGLPDLHAVRHGRRTAATSAASARTRPTSGIRA